MQHQYTEDQVKDIREREAKALAALKDLQLTPAAVVEKMNIGAAIGKDVFADSVIPYLRDTKYDAVKSPIQDVTPNKG